MTSAPTIAMPAPTRSVTVGRWPSTSHNHVSDAAMQIPPYAAYALPANVESTRVNATANPIKLATPSSAAGGLEHRGESEDAEVDHASTSADMNFRVPGGPVSSTEMGPPSGSTVMRKRRKRQHCRSASIVRAIVASRSSLAANCRRYDAGLATIIEVADSQRLLLQSEVGDPVARLGVWRALLADAAAKGDISELLK
jgi:hypothetical protein